SWTATSDARIKTVDAEYLLGLADVIQLRPVVFTYKGNDTATQELGASSAEGTKAYSGEAPYPGSEHYLAARDATQFVGLIAQEVEPIFPGMITEKDGFIDGVATSIKQLDTTPLIFALVNAVKELKAEIEALKAGA